MKNKTLIALLLACSPTLAFAHNLTVGSPVPLQDNNINYQKWRSADLLGKVRVIQAIAGRSSSKEMNAPLAKFPAESYQTTTIINQDDAIWGTSSFVKSSAQDSKKEFPWSSMVLDEFGLVAQAWQLQAESSAIIVQDKQGNVLFVKEGALNEADIQTVLGLIQQNL